MGVVSFELLAGDNKFIDVGSTMVYVECSVRMAQSEVIPARVPNPAGVGADVMNPKGKTVPVNGIGHTIFTNVKVSLNWKQIDSGSTLYPYRGDLEMHLSYPEKMKDGCLDMTGFDEEAVAFDDINAANLQYEEVTEGDIEPDASNHPALMQRFNMLKDSTTIHLMTPIHSKIFDQNKWLPLHSKLFISMEQNAANFLLLNKEAGLGENPLKVEIEKCELYVCMIEVDSNVTKEIENVSYDGSSMLYPLRCVKMEQHRIAANLRDISVSNILVGEDKLQRRIFLVFMRHDAVNGSLARDPFHYQHFGMDSIGLRIGAVEQPFPIMECNFTNGKTMKPLLALLEASGYMMGEQELGLNRYSYRGRNCIYGFDLTTSHAPPGMCFEPVEMQTIEVIAKLRTAQTFAIEMILYAEYDAELEIQPNRNVVMHNNA